MNNGFKLILSSGFLLISTYTYAVPDAVCGNGKHVGNPHCASSSSAPMGEFSSGILGAALLFSAAGIGLYMRKRALRLDEK